MNAPPRFEPQFDTVLPPRARAEFFKPKKSQKRDPRDWVGWAIAFAGLAIAGGLISQHPQEKTVGVAHPVPVVQPEPAPVPIVQTLRAIPLDNVLVRRGELLQPGVKLDYKMPYGEVVHGIFKGYWTRGDYRTLPRHAHIGDTYFIGHTPWMFTTVPGTTIPQWVDP